MVQGSAVKSFLVLEVVIEQSFVHSGCLSDGIGSSTGYPRLREFADGRLQDGSASLLRLTPGAETGFGVGGRHSFGFFALINQLVRLQQPVPRRKKRV